MIALFLLLLMALPAWAQSLDAGSVGRAGAHDLSIKTGSVLNWNPAVLAQSKGFRWSLELPSLAGSAANNAFSVNFWNKHLAGDQFFTAEDKAEILDQVPDDGWRATAQGSVPLIGFTYNRFGFHATLEGASHAVAPRDIIQLALWGNEVDHSYHLTDLAGDEQVFADYSAGFGYVFEQEWIPELNFGAGFHFYHGFSLTKIANYEGELRTTDTTLIGSSVVHAVTSKGGDGVGFDLGAMAIFSDRWQAGLAVRQLGSRLTWDVDRNHRFSFYTDSTGLNSKFLDDRAFVDSVLHRQDTVYYGGALETKLPTVIQANLRFHPHPRWAILGDASARLQESVKGPSGADAALAGEFSVTKWLLLQGGVGGGNLWGLHTGLGVGLRFRHYELDVGGAWNGGMLDGARGVALGLTQRLKF